MLLANAIKFFIDQSFLFFLGPRGIAPNDPHRVDSGDRMQVWL